MDTMNSALLSRIGQNIVKIKDYSLKDKIEIAQSHIIPGYLSIIEQDQIYFSEEILEYIIKECIPIVSKGVRELKAQIVKIIRMVKYYNVLEVPGYEYPIILDKNIINFVLNKADTPCIKKYII